MFTKVEISAAAVAVACIVLAVILLGEDTSLSAIDSEQQLAAVGLSTGAVTTQTTNEEAKNMKIEDISIGSGDAVKDGDIVSVHYAGRLENGQEFDNSKKRGAPFEFTVGAGQVIAGWEQGLIGMQVGGERTLVIPPELAYGERGIGPIPGDATLTFTIELLEIK